MNRRIAVGLFGVFVASIALTGCGMASSAVPETSRQEGAALSATNAPCKPKVKGQAVYSALLDYTPGWSAGMNPNGVWRYGWSSTLTGPIKLFSQAQLAPVDNGMKQMWLDPDNNAGFAPSVSRNSGSDFDNGNASFAAGALLLTPGEGGTYAHVVWTAPSQGLYTVAVTFYSQQYGLNAEVEVLVNGKVKFSNTLTSLGESHGFAQRFLLRTGQTVDFVVGPNGQPELHAAHAGLEAVISGGHADDE